MTRAETTKTLSDLVMVRLKNNSNFWAAEVNLDAHQRRVDFIGFTPSRNGSWANAMEVERGSFDFYEVKSSMADFNSGHGKNWEGDYNYLVCEVELAETLRDKRLLPDNLDVLCPNTSRTALVTKFKMWYSSRRNKTSSELLWAMICARDSRYIIKEKGQEESLGKAFAKMFDKIGDNPGE